jgi:hypothetical protein
LHVDQSYLKMLDKLSKFNGIKIQLGENKSVNWMRRHQVSTTFFVTIRLYSLKLFFISADVAQLVEQLTRNE